MHTFSPPVFSPPKIIGNLKGSFDNYYGMLEERVGTISVIVVFFSVCAFYTYMHGATCIKDRISLFLLPRRYRARYVHAWTLRVYGRDGLCAAWAVSCAYGTPGLL